MLFEELRILVLALQKEGALVALLATGEGLWGFVGSGGWLALGVVPTNVAASYDLPALLEAELALLEAHAPRPGAVAQLLSQVLLTPACGLGMRSVPDCEAVFDDLARAQEFLRAALRARAQ